MNPAPVPRRPAAGAGAGEVTEPGAADSRASKHRRPRQWQK
jgi:hypothetical protein